MDILLVDDNIDILVSLQHWFESTGYSVTCAAGGAEALRLLQKHRPSVMITDLHMPGIDGLILARNVRNILPTITVILCTGDSSPEVEELAREAGIAAVFAKPLNIIKVMELIVAVTPSSAAVCS